MAENKNGKNKKIAIILIIIGAIIVAAIVVGIIINNSRKMSKEDMLQVAEELNTMELTSALQDNILNAKEKYNNHVFIHKGYVEVIESDHIKVGIIDVYLDKDTLKTLNKGQRIEVVGLLNNVDIKTSTKTVAGTTYEDKQTTAEMKNAYCINDIFSITGKVSIPRRQFQYYEDRKYKTYTYTDEEWYCNVETTDKTQYSLTSNIDEGDRKFLEEGETKIKDISIKNGDTVTVRGKMIKTYTGLGKEIIEIKPIESIEIIANEN